MMADATSGMTVRSIRSQHSRRNNVAQCVSHANVREELTILVANSYAPKRHGLLCPKTIGRDITDRLSRFAFGGFDIREINALLIEDVVSEVVEVEKVASHNPFLVRLEGYAVSDTDSTVRLKAHESSTSARTSTAT
jgi:hypothetical protein